MEHERTPDPEAAPGHPDQPEGTEAPTAPSGSPVPAGEPVPFLDEAPATWPHPTPMGFPQPPAAAQPSTPPSRRNRWLVSVVAVLVAVGLVAGGFALGFQHRNTSSPPAPAATPLSIQQASPPSTHAGSAQIIQRVLPSVVNVRVTELTSNPFGGTQSSQAEGSGVVISKDGIIVTNAHVVTGATSVKVVFTDGHASLDGTVLGVDTTHDLAVIKVNADDLTPITVGTSGALELGDQVFAIGFPLGLGPTVTQGIVSGLNRSVDVQRSDGSTEHLVGLLQTDAAINPGNSGGALINSEGQLVGINTAAAQAGSAENVGFSIAIDSALPIIRQLGTESPSQRAWLGVAAGSVDSSVADQLGLPADTKGAIISSVFAGSPADKAGMQANEIIVSFGGTTIASESDLSSAIAAHKPGDTVQVGLLTAQGNKTVTVTLGTRPPGV